MRMKLMTRIAAAALSTVIIVTASPLTTQAASWHEERLTPIEKDMYDGEIRLLQGIMDNQSTGDIDTTYTYEVPTGYADLIGDLDETKAKAKEMGTAVRNLVWRNHPELLQWTGGSFAAWGSYSSSSSRITQIKIAWAPSTVYGSRNNTEKVWWLLDGSKLPEVRNAIANAKAVVAQYSSLSDYQKIKAYADWISAHVSYNHSANTNNDENLYKNDYRPYNLVYVFDEDPSTNVVCQGYAEAFQYLMDQSTFNDKTIKSRHVSSGDHGWNVVNIGGKNYFVDLTWYDDDDEDMTVPPFLLGSQKTLDELKNGTFSYYDKNGVKWSYKASASHDYSDATKAFFTADELQLSETAYVPDSDTSTSGGSSNSGGNDSSYTSDDEYEDDDHYEDDDEYEDDETEDDYDEYKRIEKLKHDFSLSTYNTIKVKKGKRKRITYTDNDAVESVTFKVLKNKKKKKVAKVSKNGTVRGIRKGKGTLRVTVRFIDDAISYWDIGLRVK